MQHESIRPYLWMLLGCVVFAVMGALAHEAAAYCDWQIIACFRAAVPLVFATALALIAGARLVLLRPPLLWLRSITGSISLVCTFYALSRQDVAVSNVFTITNMFPIWVAVLSWPLLGEPPPASVWVAVVCGVAGVVLIYPPEAQGVNSALVAALIASFTSAVAMIGLHRLRGIDVRAIVAHFSGVSVTFALVSLVLVPQQQPFTAAFAPRVVAMLLGLGLCATLGQLCLTKAFATGQPAKVSVVGLTQILFALLLDTLVFGKPPGPRTLFGIGLVLAPTAWVLTHRPRRVPEEAVRPPAEGLEAEEPTDAPP